MDTALESLYYYFVSRRCSQLRLMPQYQPGPAGVGGKPVGQRPGAGGRPPSAGAQLGPDYLCTGPAAGPGAVGNAGGLFD